jgi:hypothetical protein
MNEDVEQVEQNAEQVDNQNNIEEVDYKAMYEQMKAEQDRISQERDNYKSAMQKERSKTKEVKQVASEKTNESESYKQEIAQLMEMFKEEREEKAKIKEEQEKLSVKEEQKNRLKSMNVDLDAQNSLINLIGYDKISTLTDEQIKQAGFKFKKVEIQKENKEELNKEEPNSVENRLSKMGFSNDFLEKVKGE